MCTCMYAHLHIYVYTYLLFVHSSFTFMGKHERRMFFFQDLQNATETFGQNLETYSSHPRMLKAIEVQVYTTEIENEK